MTDSEALPPEIDDEDVNYDYEYDRQALVEFERRASEANLLSQPADSEEYTLVLMPNGESFRNVEVGPHAIQASLDGDFENWTLLGPYEAILDTSQKIVEAQLRPLGQPETRPSPSSVQISWRLSYVAGSEYLNDEGTWLKYDMRHLRSDGIRGVERINYLRKKKRIVYDTSKSGVNVEISPATDRLSILHSELKRTVDISRYYSLKLTPVTTVRHDDALKLLEEISGAIFFELDVLTGETLELDRSLRIRSMRRPVQRGSAADVRLPSKRYPRNALSLYFYALSARRMPLLEYLAYYQCVEYFFTHFTNADLLRRLGSCLDDPRFSSGDPSSLTELVSLVRQYGWTNMSEVDQLRATVKSSISLDKIRHFLDRNEPRRLALEDRKSILSNAHLKVSENELLDRVAERIYEIRCRIVHSKAEAGRRSGDPILPFSKEADLLEWDTDLLKFVAQEVILVAGGEDLWS